MAEGHCSPDRARPEHTLIVCCNHERIRYCKYSYCKGVSHHTIHRTIHPDNIPPPLQRTPSNQPHTQPCCWLGCEQRRRRVNSFRAQPAALLAAQSHTNILSWVFFPHTGCQPCTMAARPAAPSTADPDQPMTTKHTRTTPSSSCRQHVCPSCPRCLLVGSTTPATVTYLTAHSMHGRAVPMRRRTCTEHLVDDTRGQPQRPHPRSWRNHQPLAQRPQLQATTAGRQTPRSSSSRLLPCSHEYKCNCHY
jgi:hypothetical protein